MQDSRRKQKGRRSIQHPACAGWPHLGRPENLTTSAGASVHSFTCALRILIAGGRQASARWASESLGAASNGRRGNGWLVGYVVACPLRGRRRPSPLVSTVRPQAPAGRPPLAAAEAVVATAAALSVHSCQRKGRREREANARITPHLLVCLYWIGSSKISTTRSTRPRLASATYTQTSIVDVSENMISTHTKYEVDVNRAKSYAHHESILRQQAGPRIPTCMAVFMSCLGHIRKTI